MELHTELDLGHFALRDFKHYQEVKDQDNTGTKNYGTNCDRLFIGQLQIGKRRYGFSEPPGNWAESPQMRAR